METAQGGPLLDALAFALLKRRVPNAKWEDQPEYFRDHLRAEAKPVLRALGELVGDETLDLVKRIRSRHIGAQGRVLFELSDEQAAALIAAMVARKIAPER